jgi:6-phosphogluconolactonase (cycloisomerase 2 family)
VNQTSDSVTVYNRAATGSAAPIRRIAGATTGVIHPFSFALDMVNDELVIANTFDKSVVVHPRTASGDVAPSRKLAGAATQLGEMRGVTVDTVNNELLVVNFDAPSVTVYPRTASGNTAPIRTLFGVATGLSAPQLLADTACPPLAEAANDLFVADFLGNSVTVYNRTASGNAGALRTLYGPNTALAGPEGLAVDVTNNELFVANEFGHSVTVYSRTATGNSVPIRTLVGDATTLSRPGGLALDLVNNELVVTDLTNNSAAAFTRAANGNTGPLRALKGASTSLNTPIGALVDTVNNELLIANYGDASVRVFNRTASGNALPIRTLAGAATALLTPDSLVIDPANNELLVANVDGNSITSYSRTASGNALPNRTLSGAATGLSAPTFIAVASVPPNSSVLVIEFYNAGLDHYFITWVADEIAKLDAGTVIKGWVRTNQSFRTYTTPQSGTSPVRRYYIPPALGDSHFFGRGTTECNATGQKNPSFVLEDPAFMQMFLPVAGACPANTVEIYRVFSNRLDANHRYMTDAAVRAAMVAKGWLAEGDGPNLVVMCASK